ncbi:MAG TPA: glycosyltransferase, partial [Vicinamibacterales bacterium]|nr:glycosyltransferase [Vicinamibacterales bacterium]
MSDAVARWNILTGEFPPACGGVGDYTAAIARALAAAGDRVTVFTPLASAPAPALPGVRIVTLPDGYGASGRRQLDARLDAGARVLVQYVPNAFGARGANLAWCRWLRRRALAGADVRVMFHEPYFYFRWTRPRSNALAIV